MHEWAFALQEHGLAGAVVDHDIWVGHRDDLVVRCLIVPDPHLNHLNNLFSNDGLVTGHALQGEGHVAGDGGLGLGERQAVHGVGHFFCRWRCFKHTLQDAVTFGVAVQAGVQLTLGHVVLVANCFLPVGIGAVFPQHAHCGRLNDVGVDRAVLAHDHFDKGRVVDQ